MTTDFDPEGPGQGDDASEDLVEIDLNFATLRRFRAEFAPNLSYDGLFIETGEPLPASTVVRFRILLPEGFVLAEGTAVVEWTREPDSIPGLLPGMALRFVTLGDSSQETINEIVDSHIATGGFPFELEPSIGEPGEIPTDALAGSDSPLGDAWDDTAGRAAPVSSMDFFRMTVRTAGGPRDEPDQSEPPLAVEGEPEPTEEAAEVRASDDVLPTWLQEQAEARDVGLETDPAFEPATAFEPSEADGFLSAEADDSVERPVLPDDDGPAVAAPPPHLTEESAGDFEISFVDDGQEPGDTPLHPEAGPAAEVTVVPPDEALPKGRSRLWFVLPFAVLVLCGLAAVWWIVWGPGSLGEEKPAAPVPEAAGVSDQVAEEKSAPPVVPTARPTTVVEEAAPAPQPAPRPASKIVDVTAVSRGAETVVTIRGDGRFSNDSLRVSPMRNPPRVLVRIRGIESKFAPTQIEVGSPEVERIRIGHHPEERPPSLYVVLDLADAAVTVRETEVGGDTIVVFVGRR